jgi:hypothetical protein
MTTRKNQTVVTRMQPGQIDWEEDDDAQTTALARRPHSNYVPAAPAAPRFQILPPEAGGAAPLVQSPAIVETRVTGSHQDRAMGFVLETSLLALVVGVLAVLAVFVGFGQPWGVLPVLMWFWTGFGAVWLGAYALHKLMSPDGNAVLHTWGLWGYMKREQKERWAFYNRQLDRGDR